MALNLGSVFSRTDSILNGLLSKYVSVRFISFDQTTKAREYITDTITSGFYYKTRKQPVTGEVVERLKIVPASPAIDAAIRKATLLELRDADNNFVRFKIEVDKEPSPPSYEWLLNIIPNKQDTGVI